MNKAEWTDCFFYVKDLFSLDRKRIVEKILESSKCRQDLNNKDSYQKNKLKDRYGRKQKKSYGE